MKISEAASKIKVPIKKIRYYSDIGLIRPSRVNNGYRDFTENDLIKLQLIVKSRSFGFSIKECSTLIKLFENKSIFYAIRDSSIKNILSTQDISLYCFQWIKFTRRYLFERSSMKNKVNF